MLETGRVFGGDSQFYYLGKYSVSGAAVQAEIRVTHYHGPTGTAFGDTAASFDVKLDGKLSGGVVDGTMTRPGLGSRRFRMTKQAELP